MTALSVTRLENAGADVSAKNPLPIATSGQSFSASATFTPSAAAYSAGNTVDVAKQFAAIGPAAGGEVIITSAVLEIDESALISGETTYTLELYNVTPPSAQADNSAFSIVSGDRAAHIGSISLGAPAVKGATLKGEFDGVNKQITVLSGGAIFAELVTVGAFTATAVARKVTLHSIAV